MTSAQLLWQQGEAGSAQLAQAVSLLLLLGGAGVTLVALFILAFTLFPRLSQRARQNVETMPGRSFVVGLVNFLFFALVALALASRGGVPALLGGLLALALLALAGLGWVAVALLAGSRLWPKANDTTKLASGAALLLLAALAPLFGWFIVAPLSSLVGLGAVLIALLRRGKIAPAPIVTESDAQGDLP